MGRKIECCLIAFEFGIWQIRKSVNVEILTYFRS